MTKALSDEDIEAMHHPKELLAELGRAWGRLSEWTLDEIIFEAKHLAAPDTPIEYLDDEVFNDTDLLAGLRKLTEEADE